MRLIDADALPIKTTWNSGAKVVFVRDIDAATTVSCERCENWDEDHDEDDVLCGCAESQCYLQPLDPTDACSYFTERTP